jgi:high-affinity nickel permease
LLIGLALLLGSPLVFYLGVFVVEATSSAPSHTHREEQTLAITRIGVGVCIAGTVIMVVGAVFILYAITKVIIEKRRERPDDDDDEMSDTDVLLTAEVEELLAA